MRVPIAFIAITGLGLVVWTAAPFIGRWVALPSVRMLTPFQLADLPQLLFQLAAYSVFPGSAKSWSDVSWAIFLMSLVIADRLTHRLYATAFLVGAAAGGIAFLFTGPSAVFIGPVMAAYGLVGFYCVAALYNWKTLHWAGRLYSLLVFAVGPFTIVNAFTKPPGTSVAEATAMVASLLLAARLVPRPRLVGPSDQRTHVEPAQA